MGVRSFVEKVESKASDKIAKMSALSPEQLDKVQERREKYLSEMPDPNDSAAEELTKRLLAASSVEIYNAYLPQIKELYVPIDRTVEYGGKFNPAYNIRFFNITKWVTDKKEKSLEKLVNVYEVLSNEDCNIALVFHRTSEATQVYLAVTNIKNANNKVDVENYKRRLSDAIRGNFPGSEWKEDGEGVLPCLNNNKAYSVAAASNIPTEKSEKFISQTIEKLLDGIVPDDYSKEYTIILLATPIRDVEERKLRLAEFYTGLVPYASWNTTFTYNESNSEGASATIGLNVGASAGIQNGQNQAITRADGTTDSVNQTETESEGETKTNSVGDSKTTASGVTESDSATHTENTSHTHTDTKGSGNTLGVGASQSVSVGGNAGIDLKVVKASGNITGTVGLNENYSHNWNKSTAEALGTSLSDAKTKGMTQSLSESIAQTTNRAVASTVNHAVANTLGRAVSNTVSKTAGVFRSINLGANFGANFARSSNVTATVGKNQGITQSYTNYNIKHTLELLEEQMKRFEQGTALGMWDFAAYVLSEDQNVANNVAHSYIALTQGEESYMSKAAINLWRGDMGERSNNAKEICGYLRELRHPIFGLNPEITEELPIFNVYPPVVTATTSLSGKELAYSLNFPQRSVAGLPVIECAEFGRNIVTYDSQEKEDLNLNLGNIFHMNHKEKTEIQISKNSLSSHTFITGSTGSGKSNTIYQILDKVRKENTTFLVIEPAKGEYKEVFGQDKDVVIYGTNPLLMPLLRINPFHFPDGIHVLEHLDRLVEIFNVCWPMYAAMPAVLKSAVEKSYADCGWDLLQSTNSYGGDLYPSFADVARNIKSIIESSEYDTENKGAYKGSLLTRLQSLSNGINGLIFSQNAISDNDLFDRNVIIDLSRVGSSETKSLIMGMLVLKLQEYRMTSSESMNMSLRHITVLEEAHHLLKRTSMEQSGENANLLGKSVEMIGNAIAEMRTYGEGFVIADQAPGLLDMSIIRNTNTKIIMRLPDQSDRELVGRAANLDEDQIIELAKLPCGVAAIYQNEWIQPVLCKVNEYKTEGKKYCYHADDKKVNENKDLKDCFYIAELLSKGTAVGRDGLITDICPRLKKLEVDASLQVAILKMLSNPTKEPRMTKLGPIMSALFPNVREAIVDAYFETKEMAEWTRAAERALEACIAQRIDAQVRRDIIQAVITDYIYNELNDKKVLQEWSERGELR